MSLYRALRPLLFTLPPETAHHMTLRSLALMGRLSRPKADDHALSQQIWGLEFPNPLGMAAGFDKDGEAIKGVQRIGFGFSEIGTLTPLPQDGNPAPRVFRLPEADALINRLGFNNRGQIDALHRLQILRAGARSKLRPIGVNIGANKEAADRIADYEKGAARFGAPRPDNLADYLTVNISSPNTPGLRDLQGGEAVVEIMQRVRAAAPDIPILVKIAPDLEIAQACEIGALALEHKIDGLIISNTTLERSAVSDMRHGRETGGLSGQPVYDMSTEMLSEVYAATQGRLRLVGVGGVGSAQQAYGKICAGASLVQLYTGLVYHGPALVGQIKRGLVELLRRDGFKTIADAVGSAHNK